MKKSFIMLALLAASVTVAFSQTIRKKADTQYQLYNYAKAVSLYQEIYKDKKTYTVAHQIASCYRFMNDHRQAASWFTEAMNYNEHIATDELYAAEALRKTAKYAEAAAVYKSYAQKVQLSYDEQSLWLRSCDTSIVWMQHPLPYQLVGLQDFNTAGSDWGLIKQGDQFVYCSDDVQKQAKKQGSLLSLDAISNPIDKNTYGWTGRGYLTILTKKGSEGIKTLFNDEDKRTYHMAAPWLSDDGKEVFYTVTRLVKAPKNNAFKNQPITAKLEIYSRTCDDNGEWSAPVPFRYNNPLSYSVGDPYLTANGKYLYFVSDMPGGFGGTDIYYCKREPDGSWGEAINAGAIINTAGNERFPRFSTDETFYFSSDGRIGLGGLDIFAAKTTNQGFQRPQSLKYPINSPQDDFAIFFTGNNEGYLSSNRDGGKGDDDIYAFSLRKDLISIKGLLVDKFTQQPLENAVLTFKNLNNNEITKVITDANGNYSAELDKNAPYDVLVEKSDYISQSEHATPATSFNDRKWSMEPIQKNVGIRIENIYYNFDKWDLRSDAKTELNKLVKLLIDNPTMEIELGSHTDSRGSDNYNLKLSQKRAESVVNYLISNGIDKNRLTAKGYGETQPVNQCTNGAKCTEAEFQANRRTEFKITRY